MYRLRANYISTPDGVSTLAAIVTINIALLTEGCELLKDWTRFTTAYYKHSTAKEFRGAFSKE
jgi:hypothetical protein